MQFTYVHTGGTKLRKREKKERRLLELKQVQGLDYAGHEEREG